MGHSCGGGFLVRWLSENDVKVGKVVLVAPWMNATDPDIVPGFFDFKIDQNLVSKTTGLHVLVSSDDHKEMLDTAKMLEENIKDLKIQWFTDKGHFCISDLGGEEFPEVLTYLL